MIFDRTMLAYMDEQGEMGLLEPISILFLSKQVISGLPVVTSAGLAVE